MKDIYESKENSQKQNIIAATTRYVRNLKLNQADVRNVACASSSTKEIVKTNFTWYREGFTVDNAAHGEPSNVKTYGPFP